MQLEYLIDQEVCCSTNPETQEYNMISIGMSLLEDEFYNILKGEGVIVCIEGDPTSLCPDGYAWLYTRRTRVY